MLGFSLEARCKQGAHPTWKENRSEGESIYLLDPDGHKLEVHVGSLGSRLAALRKEAYEGDESVRMEGPQSGQVQITH